MPGSLTRLLRLFVSSYLIRYVALTIRPAECSGRLDSTEGREGDDDLRRHSKPGFGFVRAPRPLWAIRLLA
jgi:hypothetical protein